MAKYRVLKGWLFHAGGHHPPGKVLDLPEEHAALHVASGHLERAEEPAVPTEAHPETPPPPPEEGHDPPAADAGDEEQWVEVPEGDPTPEAQPGEGEAPKPRGRRRRQ